MADTESSRKTDREDGLSHSVVVARIMEGYLISFLQQLVRGEKNSCHKEYHFVCVFSKNIFLVLASFCFEISLGMQLLTVSSTKSMLRWKLYLKYAFLTLHLMKC